jgi:hypothetical protein
LSGGQEGGVGERFGDMEELKFDVDIFEDIGLEIEADILKEWGVCVLIERSYEFIEAGEWVWGSHF